METEKIEKQSGINITFKVLIILFPIFLIYYVIMSMMSPGHKMREVQAEYTSKSVIDSTLNKEIFSDSTYLRLLKEKAFLQSRTIMAETDSIYLTINLSDSTSNIEISGVTVHKAKMSHVETSSMLIKGDENIILSILSAPFTIAYSYATIKREPVMIKMAPKDTSEYKPDIMPDTSIVEPVSCVLEMTNGTRIFIYQEEDENGSERRNQFRFDLKLRVRDFWDSFKSVAVFKVPDYHPYIKMRLPRADARIIYRALPKHGQVGVYR